MATVTKRARHASGAASGLGFGPAPVRLVISAPVADGWIRQRAGAPTIGAELELFLIDRAGRPCPRNRAIGARAADPRVTVELNRFNLELNASPAPLAGRPFGALGGELQLLLDRVAGTAARQAARLALIGILPTLRLEDLGRT